MEIGVRRGHWKCHRSIERVSLLIDVLLQVTVISEIFNVVKYRDLEISVKSQTRSLKVPFDRLGMISH